MEVTLQSSFMCFLVKSLVHQDSNYEEDWLNAHDDEAGLHPELDEDVLTVELLALLEKVSGATKDSEVEDEGDEGPYPAIVRSDVLAIVEGNKLCEESPESVDCQNDHNLQSWLEVSRSKEAHEVNVGETDEHGLDEQSAHVAEVEELGLQVHDEVLGFSIVPDVGVHVRDSFVTGDWFEMDYFTQYEEKNSRNNPIEEENNLEEQPCTDVVHVSVMPFAEVLLDDVYNETKHIHGNYDENRLQSLTPYEPIPSL